MQANMQIPSRLLSSYSFTFALFVVIVVVVVVMFHIGDALLICAVFYSNNIIIIIIDCTLDIDHNKTLIFSTI